MGFRYRKSIKLPGGFRINLSKSGIGYSWGVKGYRVAKTAKGTTRTTASIPGTGISYVQESKSAPKSTPPATNTDVSSKPKKRSGCLIQVLAIPLILLIIGVIVGPRDKDDNNQKNSLNTNQTVASSEVRAKDSSNRRPDVETIKSEASDYLSRNFQLDVVDLRDKTMRYEIKVTSDGISNREDQSKAPENWDGFLIDFVSAQARLSDEIEVSSDKAMLILVDSDDDIILSARNGRIVDNRYKADPKEQEEPEKPKGTNTKPTERTVWVTSSGKKYHYNSTCSGMQNPRSIPISEAKAKGYTACSKCA